MPEWLVQNTIGLLGVLLGGGLVVGYIIAALTRGQWDFRPVIGVGFLLALASFVGGPLTLITAVLAWLGVFLIGIGVGYLWYIAFFLQATVKKLAETVELLKYQTKRESS